MRIGVLAQEFYAVTMKEEFRTMIIRGIYQNNKNDVSDFMIDKCKN